MEEEHLKHSELVFEKFREAGIKLKLSKCEFFSETIRALIDLTRENFPFKLADQCQRSLEYIKQVIKTNPILIYPDPNKQYYLFTDSSKHSRTDKR